ncbi:MAG: hypothetical protein F2517_03480 [Actinobacteria bacterium]|nr:hypothetical protein [Actinomycetota bacterium]
MVKVLHDQQTIIYSTVVYPSQTPSAVLIACAYSWRLEVVAPEHEHRRHLSRDERTPLRDSISSIDPWRFRLQIRRRVARLGVAGLRLGLIWLGFGGAPLFWWM